MEWPEINFEEINHYDIENKMANVMYKGVVVSLFMPQILIRAFYEVLRFKG